MCGRFTQFYTWAEIRAAMGLTDVPRHLQLRHNIAPATTVDVVRTGSVRKTRDRLDVFARSARVAARYMRFDHSTLPVTG
jgi:putative SOS response-associated peptidase YedK